MKRVLFLSLVFIPQFLGALTADEMIGIENKVFKKNDLAYVKGLKISGQDQAAQFQNALVHYRLGNILTNKSHTQKSVDLLTTLVARETNVYTLSYLAIAWGSKARFEKSMKSVKTTLKLLNQAVELYPEHYLPRFYRGMMFLFMPSIVGGNKKQGQKDMEMVINQIHTIERDDNYKAMVYFTYGAYWGHIKNYDTALKYIAKARSKVTDEKLLEAIDEKEAEWKTKIQKKDG